MVAAARVDTACGVGGAADLLVIKRDLLSKAATVLVRVATYSTSAGSLFKIAGGGV